MNPNQLNTHTESKADTKHLGICLSHLACWLRLMPAGEVEEKDVWFDQSQGVGGGVSMKENEYYFLLPLTSCLVMSNCLVSHV